METASLPSAAIAGRYFTTPGVNPLDGINWISRDAWPEGSKYHNPNVLVPDFWRQNDLDVVSKLYLSANDPVERKSVRRLIERVCSKIVIEGMGNGYLDVPDLPNVDSSMFKGEFISFLMDNEFDDVFWNHMKGDNTAAALYAELCYIAVNQMAAWNSPVWFNVGRQDRIQQVSACYILGVEDNTGSIMETAVRNAFIFKYGSGAGYNLSRIRGANEKLSTGGTASGPMSFRRMYDGVNGTFKSGGMTRRGAELVCMDADHPDVHEFIWAKPGEEKVMAALHAAGFNISMDEEGEKFIAQVTAFQNANMSVRATDEFMLQAVEGTPHEHGTDHTWTLHDRSTGLVTKTSARALLEDIAQAAWECADPGMQFHDHFNGMHTTPMIDGKESPIRSTNPCGEYASNDDTSCNLASINALKFVAETPTLTPGGQAFEFDVEGYRHVVDTFILSMDILVEFSQFPDDPDVVDGGKGKFRKYTRALRQLGLGYANIGAAILAQGLAYDSDEGRDFAASVMALTTGRAYRKSAELAEQLGSFHYFEENRAAMFAVIDKHIAAIPELADGARMDRLWDHAIMDWTTARIHARAHGFRNAQATVIAPTGSISYLMGCDSTGIEPIYSLVTYKDLAGGGTITLVNGSTHRGLKGLGYSDKMIGDIEDHISEHGELPDGDLQFQEEHRPIFDGANEISPAGHIRMLGAVQPFVSGGISKTVNMEEDVSVEDILNAYILAWRLGVKNVAIYRNNSKVRQVLSSVKPREAEAVGPDDPTLSPDTPATRAAAGLDEEVAAQVDPRMRMPKTRMSITHKIHVKSDMGDHEGYLIAGMYPDGRLGEIFLEGFGKLGGFTQNALSAFATDASIGWQYKVPMDVWCRKHAFMGDETGGMVIWGDSDQRWFASCTSIIDYIARWVAGQFGNVDLQEELGVMTDAVKARKTALLDGTALTVTADIHDGELSNVSASVRTEPWIQGLEPFASNGHGKTVVQGPPCRDCGLTMHRAGACWVCKCGNTTGCG